MKPTNAAIYVRISDDRVGDAAGVGRQEEDARALAERLGWGVGPVIVENDVSAYKRRKITLPSGGHELRVIRPGFRNLLDLIMIGEVDGMIAYDLDRTARDPRDLEDLIDAVEQSRPPLPVESVTGSLRLANDSDVTMARVMVAIANKSSRDSSRRIRRKHEELAKAGKYGGGGRRRFGFEADGVTHNPREAEALRWAAKEILAGKTVGVVARTLDKRGITPVVAARWSPKALTDMLRSPRIVGQRTHRGEVVGKAEWEPILDEDTYDAVVAELILRSRGAPQPALRRWCNMLLFCGRCEHPLAGSYVASDGRYRYWCNPRRGGCGRISTQGPKTEAEIERQVLTYLTRPDVLAKFAETRSTDGAQRARASIADDEEQLLQLARAHGNKQITFEEYMEARRPIAQRLKDARALTLAVVPDRVRRVLDSDDVTEAWQELDPQGKREVARIVLEAHGYAGWTVRPVEKAARVFDPRRLVLRKADDEAADTDAGAS